MPSSFVIDVSRHTLQQVLLLAAPILAVALVVSLIVNIVQVLTSLQEPTISAVPRLVAVGGASFLLMPWMWHRMVEFTIQMLSDFHPYVQ